MRKVIFPSEKLIKINVDQTDRKADREADIPIGRQAGRPDRQTGRQINKYSCIQTLYMIDHASMHAL